MNSATVQRELSKFLAELEQRVVPVNSCETLVSLGDSLLETGECAYLYGQKFDAHHIFALAVALCKDIFVYPLSKFNPVTRIKKLRGQQVKTYQAEWNGKPPAVIRPLTALEALVQLSTSGKYEEEWLVELAKYLDETGEVVDVKDERCDAKKVASMVIDRCTAAGHYDKLASFLSHAAVAKHAPESLTRIKCLHMAAAKGPTADRWIALAVALGPQASSEYEGKSVTQEVAIQLAASRLPRSSSTLSWSRGTGCKRRNRRPSA